MPRVPVNPNTQTPTQQLGYQRAPDFGQGNRMIAAVVDSFGAYLKQEKEQKEEFDLSKRMLEEVDFRQTDFDTRQSNAELGAPNFVQNYTRDMAERNQSVLQELRDRGMSDGSLKEAELRLLQLSGNFAGRAMAFRDEQEKAKSGFDVKDMAKTGSSFAFRNPEAIDSVLAEGDSILTMPNEASVNEQYRQYYRDEIIDSSWRGLATKNPRLVLDAVAPFIRQQATTGQVVASGKAQKVGERLKTGGLPAHVVAAFLGNFEVEGGYNGSKGDGGIAAGIAQWRLERRAAFKKMFGKDPSRASMEDQAAFVLHEMENPIPAGMSISQRDEILTAGSVKEAAELIDKYYERSSGKHRAKRVAAAERYFRTTTGTTSPIIPGNLPTTIRQTVQNNDGSVSTVRTISIGTDKGEVLIPTVIDGQVVSDKEAIAHYKETGENFGTFRSVNDANAFAESLHKQHEAQQALYSDPVLSKLDGQQLTQAYELADRVVSIQARDLEAAQKLDHQAAVNSLYNQIEDGTAGQKEIDAAYEGGLLADFDERNKAQGILDAKTKTNGDLEFYSQMLNAGVNFNPYDKNAQDAVEAGVAKAIEIAVERGLPTTPLQIVENIWQRTGIFAKQGQIMLRGGLASSDPKQVALAASVAANMLNPKTGNPNVFAGMEGGAEVEQAAQTYAHYVDDLMLSAEDAAAKIMQANLPEAKRAVKENAPERTAFIANVRKLNIDDVLVGALNGGKVPWFAGLRGLDGEFVNEQQRTEAAQTFAELALANYDKYQDPEAAVASAKRQMSKFYGAEGGRIMKFPPSRAYPAINGSRAYVLEQAKEEVDGYSGLDVPLKDIWLAPAGSGATAEAFRAGRPVPYELYYRTEVNGFTKYNMIPNQLFVADVAQAKAITAKTEGELSKRTRQRDRDIEAAKTSAPAIIMRGY